MQLGKVILANAFSLKSQSPYGARWFATDRVALKKAPFTLESQSPYGAKWFATRKVLPGEKATVFPSQSP